MNSQDENAGKRHPGTAKSTSSGRRLGESGGGIDMVSPSSRNRYNAPPPRRQPSIVHQFGHINDIHTTKRDETSESGGRKPRSNLYRAEPPGPARLPRSGLIQFLSYQPCAMAVKRWQAQSSGRRSARTDGCALVARFFARCNQIIIETPSPARVRRWQLQVDVKRGTVQSTLVGEPSAQPGRQPGYHKAAPPEHPTDWTLD